MQSLCDGMRAPPAGEASWLPERLAIVENISRRENKGLSTTLQLYGTSEASGQRDLHNLKFG